MAGKKVTESHNLRVLTQNIVCPVVTAKPHTVALGNL